MSEVTMGREPVSVPVRPPLIELAGVEKVYRTGKVEYRALRGVDLTIERGDMVAIVGPSGSGKSTVMNMITGIDRPSAGTVTVDGHRIDEMSEEELAIWRGRRVGVVFQFFQLLPTLTALENAMLPLDFSRRVRKRGRAGIARRNLELVGLADKADNLPAELSGRRRADRQPRHPHRGRDVRPPAAAQRRGVDHPLRHARPRAGEPGPPDRDDPRRRRRGVRRFPCPRQPFASPSRT
jgi:hypothetical protein